MYPLLTRRLRYDDQVETSTSANDLESWERGEVFLWQSLGGKESLIPWQRIGGKKSTTWERRITPCIPDERPKEKIRYPRWGGRGQPPHSRNDVIFNMAVGDCFAKPIVIVILLVVSSLPVHLESKVFAVPKLGKMCLFPCHITINNT